MTARVLMSIGLYSTVSSTLRRRTREMAIRIALGARPAAIRRIVLVQALAPVATGIGAGSIAAPGLTPFLRERLFGISPSDPRIFALTAIVLAGVSLVAGYLPGSAPRR
jgi:putative ABC transport system permease protein